MGLYYSVYVGPYLECTTHMVDSTKEEFRCWHGCTQKTYNYTNEKFCPKCGTEIKKVEVPSKEKAAGDFQPMNDSFSPLYNESDSIDLTDIWIPNVKLFSRETHYSDSIPFVQNVDSNMLYTEIDAFKIDFKEELYDFKKNYDSVEIKWGVIGDLS